MIVQSFYYILLAVCMLARCDVAQADCSYPGGRQPKDLTRLEKLKNKRFSCEAVADESGKLKTYVYNVGICTSAEVSPEGPTADAGALQHGKDESGDPVVIGKYTDADFREGDDWLMLEYYGGKPYGHHCSSGSNRTAVIMMICTPGKTGQLTMIEESNSDGAKNCFYLFELKTKYACSSKNTLSVGSIIVIVFLSLVAVYLLFGMLFQRFVKGAKGLEQIPNYSFWTNMGNMAADGCDLVFRSHSAAESREYRGLSGENMDQEIPRDSNTPDDHLLSM